MGITAIFSAIGGISGIFKTVDRVHARINDLKKAQLEAGTEERKAEIGLEIERLQAQAGVLEEEAKHARTAWVRPALAFPAVVILTKLLAWDKAVGSLAWCAGDRSGYWNLDYCGVFVTDPLDERAWWYIVAVVTSYMLGRAYEKARGR